jgi:hypothetical protein
LTPELPGIVALLVAGPIASVPVSPANAHPGGLNEPTT